MTRFATEDTAAEMTRPSSPPERDSARVAEYIADLSRGLALTAREHGLSILAHLLDMACAEAATNSQKANDAPPIAPIGRD